MLTSALRPVNCRLNGDCHPFSIATVTSIKASSPSKVQKLSSKGINFCHVCIPEIESVAVTVTHQVSFLRLPLM